MTGGLRYVTDEVPGITRELRGKHFVYFAPDGTQIVDGARLAHIRSLAVPPAYTNVWICPWENGHLQATGRDARGRKQYRYHPRWREVRDATKYDRMIAFARALPRIRAAVATDLARPGMPREKLLAVIVDLLQSTAIRIGNQEYAKQNGSFGLTTLRNRHVKIEGATVRFTFRGKSGIKHSVSLRDRRLARVIARCLEIPGQQLFEYIGDDGTPHAVESAEVNDYIRALAGEEFSAKDFRTWLGTVSCAALLRAAPDAPTDAQRKQQVNEAIRQVARRLGNTAAICKKCYVHPRVIDAFLEEGVLRCAGSGQTTAALSPDETFALALLCAQEQPARKKNAA